jgi:hypothetical protein
MHLEINKTQKQIILNNSYKINFVDSLYLCDINGCNEKTIIMNSSIANGRRCIKHVPTNWINIAEINLIHD